jgi:hypothetical protein
MYKLILGLVLIVLLTGFTYKFKEGECIQNRRDDILTWRITQVGSDNKCMIQAWYREEGWGVPLDVTCSDFSEDSYVKIECPAASM